MSQNNKQEVWLIYDGDCPFCNATAKALKIREAVGALHIVNARENPPVMKEINVAGLNLDEGMVVKIGDRLYYGADAQHVLAMIGSEHDGFNRMNVVLFRSKTMAKILYPLFKTVRNIVLKIKGISKIHNLKEQPIFKPVFGKQWDDLPAVMHKHYADRPFSNDEVILSGKMTIASSKMMNALFPLFRFLHLLVPYQGQDIPVEIHLRSDPKSSVLHFDRTFYFPKQKPYHFNSYSVPLKNNIVVEFFILGIGWKCAYEYQNQKVALNHLGYVLNFFGFYLPLPMSFIFGKVHFEKEALSENALKLKMKLKHWLFGNYSYNGEFKIVNVKTNSDTLNS